ncbi:MAG: hypothetical protein BWX81_00767 [Spirochaetes bacterium ADurb.Bin110]|nr:MAG: hypothetical protein BWX81_00767 [Spirochaetes bacterium ADurb.Bin110]
MKRFALAVFILPILLASCASINEKENSNAQPYDSTYIEFDNYLPSSIKHIVDANTFANIISDEPVRFPTYLSIEISGDQIISKVAFDIEGADTSAVCYGDILSLGAVERYMNYLNKWLFANKKNWDVNLSAAMGKYRHLFVVQFWNGDSFLEIQGRGSQNISIQNSLYIKMPRKEVLEVSKRINRSSNGIYYIDLDPCYDPITMKYLPTYFVYKFFDRRDVLQNIPKPNPWSQIY